LAGAELYRFTDQDGHTYYTNTPGDGRVKVALPIEKLRPQALSAASPGEGRKREAFQSIISSASRIFSVDADLIRAVIKAESDFNPRAVSPKGAMGLMQLMPGTALEMGVADPFDPEQNIRGGVRYLSQLLRLWDGQMPLALAAYNAGPGKVPGRSEIPAFEETRHYIQRVLYYYRNLKSKNDFSKP
jgi:soluble lytic murein transglycosylase-like protein